MRRNRDPVRPDSFIIWICIDRPGKNIDILLLMNPASYSLLQFLPDAPVETSQTAKDITVIVDSDIKKRENRIVLGIGFKHLPVYFTGVIKTRWNPEDGHDGDYKFEVVHPDNIDVDETCPTNNADDMSFVSHLLSLTVQEVIMRFPEKKDEFIKELQLHGLMNGTGDKKDQDMASTVTTFSSQSNSG